MADTFIYSASPDNNGGANPVITAGTDGHGGVRRSLLRFDVASFVPAGSAINSATLRLTVARVPMAPAGPSNFDLYRMQAAWGEGDKSGNTGLGATAGEATWNDRLFGSQGWTAPGALGDAAGSSSASATAGFTFGEVLSWSSAALNSDVQFWLNNPAQNFGWLLVCDDEVTLRGVRGFTAKEGGAGAGALVVNYTPPLEFTSIRVVNSTNLHLTWSGGTGPFAVQRKIQLSDLEWLDETIVTGNTATVPLRNPSGFFRLLDTAR